MSRALTLREMKILESFQGMYRFSELKGLLRQEGQKERKIGGKRTGREGELEEKERCVRETTRKNGSLSVVPKSVLGNCHKGCRLVRILCICLFELHVLHARRDTKPLVNETYTRVYSARLCAAPHKFPPGVPMFYADVLW